MLLSKTYFFKSSYEYLKTLIVTTITFATIILIFDSLEVARITSKHNISIFLVLKLALMKNYSSFSKVIPFLVLFASLIFFQDKNKRNEIIAAKSLGIDSIQILFPIIVITLLFGVVNMLVINPIGTTMVKKYQQYKNHRFSQKDLKSTTTIAKSGIWLKQKMLDDTVIVNALKISQFEKKMYDVSAFIVDDNGHFKQRIYAKSLFLEEGRVLLNNATTLNDKFQIEKKDKLYLPLNLSMSQITNNITEIESISFFELLKFIEVAKQFGFSTSKYLMYFFKEILNPLFLLSMLFISYSYSMEVVSRKKFNPNIFFAVITGFILFLISNFVFALGISNQISFLLAVIFPPITANFFALYLFLHKK